MARFMQNAEVLNIFENEVKPCEGEKKVKAYHVSQLRDRLRSSSSDVYAEGILTITNKRVIYRTTKNTRTLDFIHSEVPIEDVAGVAIKRGQYRDMSLNIAPILGLIFGIFIPILFIFPNLARGAFFKFALIYYLIFFVILVIGSIFKYKKPSIENFKNFARPMFQPLFRMKSLISLTILSKGGAQSGISMATSMRGSRSRDLSAEVVPLDDLLVFSEEIGAIINDIQKNGEYTGNLDI